MKLVLLFLLFFVGSTLAAPPDPKNLVEVVEVDLDKRPEERWVAIVKEKAAAIKVLLGIIKPVFDQYNVTEELVVAVKASLPEEYIQEMQGIATALNLDVEDVLKANLFYEITGVANTPFDLSRSCTSICAQQGNGTVYLARNQDYPPPFTLIMIHAIFKKKGETVFQGTTFAGTIGLSTAAAFSPPSAGSVSSRWKGWEVSINARGNPKRGTKAGEAEAVAAAKAGAAIFPFLTRMAMEHAGADYHKAVKFLSSHPLIMPGYIIVAGSSPGEGAVVTRNATAEGTDVFTLFDKRGPDHSGGAWYIVQTNTDHWKPAPTYPGTNTSRRVTATQGLDRIGQNDTNLLALWDVLGTPPTFNFATIHTDLVAAEWKEYRTYKRNGPL